MLFNSFFSTQSLLLRSGQISAMKTDKIVNLYLWYAVESLLVFENRSASTPLTCRAMFLCLVCVNPPTLIRYCLLLQTQLTKAQEETGSLKLQLQTVSIHLRTLPYLLLVALLLPSD